MFEAANLPRIPMQNPDYREPVNSFILPSKEERIAAIVAEKMERIQQAERPLDVVKFAQFEDTPSGKRARGQLEDEVLYVCSQFSRGELDEEILTPAIIGALIDESNPPSVGAIVAVFNRWTKIGFANYAQKPLRFESFTAAGLERGLQKMKVEFKDAEKRNKRIPNKLFGR